MSDGLDGLFYRWRGKAYKGAMRDYRQERAAAAQLRQQNTEHSVTRQHRLGREKRKDYYCDACAPHPVADEAKAKRERKRERKRK